MQPLRIIPYIFLIFISILSECTHKVVPKASQPNTYYEDLSGQRPEFHAYEPPKPFKLSPRDTVIKAPVMDVTLKVNTILDSMYALNRQTQFSQLTILVTNSNSREEAEQARLDVFRIIPGSKPTLDFVPPTYRVKLGKYFNELEAYQTLQKIKKQFPNAIIVPEPVYFR